MSRQQLALKWIFVTCLVAMLPACQLLANNQTMIILFVLVPAGLLFVVLWILYDKGEGREEGDDSIPDYDEDDDELRDDDFRF
ncbi:MAG: hypothetical protein KAJ19_02635 [Gammaproteobacteria bacterium]|nr:hypothetical protein [Gammaproteobacteria bacterium]